MNEKIPVLKSIGDTVRFLWENVLEFARPTALAVFLLTIVDFVIWLPADEQISTGYLPILIFEFFVLTTFAVACHRIYLVPDETMTFKRVILWRTEHIRYAIRFFFPWMCSLLLIAMAFLAIGGASHPLRPAGMSVQDLWPMAQAVAWAVVILYLFARIFAVLPSVAVGGQMRLADSRQLTRGNGWRIAAAIVVAGVPSLLIITLADYAEILASSQPMIFVWRVVGHMIAFAALALELTLLSVIFARLLNSRYVPD